MIIYTASYGKHLYCPHFTPYSEKYVSDWFRHTDDAGQKYRTRSRKGQVIRQYLDKSPGMPLSTIWSDIMQLSSRRGLFTTTKKEETGYPTQKPLALLERIIKTSSNEDDRTFDPFCGCATSLVAADRLSRRWAGIDLSPLAVKLVNDRIRQDRGGDISPVPLRPMVRLSELILETCRTIEHISTDSTANRRAFVPDVTRIFRSGYLRSTISCRSQRGDGSYRQLAAALQPLQP